ncbi:MAG: prepilin-type N-terminal cleavage/methylation domain-containing protein [Labilithrix sp.]|nr:prepilin-type N-terminal cleavage/methylation domain-containing protein [Labilithrix sp.]
MSVDSRGKARAGFTLVELAVVVTIVGVLAVIAVVGYRKLTLSSKITEAETMISAIRIAQEDYKTERGLYANVGGTYCPSNGATQHKWGWNPACAGGGTVPDWRALPVHTESGLQFGYATVAGTKNPGTPLGLSWVNFASAPNDVPWYVIHAKADLNNDGAVFSELVGTSFQGTIFTNNVGE